MLSSFSRSTVDPGVAIVLCAVSVLALWFVPTGVHADVLPSVTSLYTSVVSAGFGNLHFSLHYTEYGNITGNIAAVSGRYYSPLDLEWMNLATNQYFEKATDPNSGAITCNSYSLSEVAATRMILPAAFVLTGIQTDGISFTFVGSTNSVRVQQSLRYSTRLSWSTSSGRPPSNTLENLLVQAYVLGGADTSGAYTFNLTLDVYFSANAQGGLLNVAGGAVPLRFSITGTSQNGQAQPVSVNIVYDFFQWSAYVGIDVNFKNVLIEPNPDPYTGLESNCSQAFGLPPPLPVGSLLPATEGPPLWHGSAESTIEMSGSNIGATSQIYAFHNVEYGQERLDYLANPDTHVFNSYLYEYYFGDERDFRFQNGAVYNISNPFYNYLGDTTCNGAAITAATVSPLQWTDAAKLNTLFADGAAYFNGSTSMPRQTVRGIITDAWQVRKIDVFLGVIYDYTITVYAVANGWANLGRSVLNLTPEIIRIYYAGTMTDKSGVAVPYWLQLDFFTQVFVNFANAGDIFDPQNYGCEYVATNGTILPPLPPQYSVTISAAFNELFYSIQYTEYVDVTKNLRRIDGRFAPPNTFSLVSPLNSTFVYLQQWSQNASLAAGFSGDSLLNELKYTEFQQSSSSGCAEIAVSASEFNASATMNFFDYLALTNPSEAVYEGTFIHRGVECDKYQASFAYRPPGCTHICFGTLYTFEIYFLAADETTTAVIPLSAEVTAHQTGGPILPPVNILYEFYNFRSVLPPGIFNAPPIALCPANASILPGATPNTHRRAGYFPDPSTDGTPTSAPSWNDSFSLLIEGQPFLESGDANVYTMRWYTDFAHFRERLDIEPSFDISGVDGVTPKRATYIYYYHQQQGAAAGQFSLADGILVNYDGKSCQANSISANTINPLKQVTPGNLFNLFFPASTELVSASTSYGGRSNVDGFYSDQYNWSGNTVFGGSVFNVTHSIFLAMPEWLNNPNAVGYSYNRIPVELQSIGLAYDQNGNNLGSYSRFFDLSHYQPYNPGLQYFDAAILGCVTTPDSPWYNIYGDQPLQPASSSSSTTTAVIVGVVVGVGGGLGLILALGCFYLRKGRTASAGRYGSGSKGVDNDNELAGVGRVRHDAENSLNKASLNKELSHMRLPVEGEVDIDDTANTAAGSAATSTDS